MMRPYVDPEESESPMEAGRVSEARRAWMLRTDKEFAHKLQDDEIVHHLSGNKCRNEQIREDFPVAATVFEEDRTVHQRELMKKKLLLERDARIAEELQKKIVAESNGASSSKGNHQASRDLQRHDEANNNQRYPLSSPLTPDSENNNKHIDAVNSADPIPPDYLSLPAKPARFLMNQNVFCNDEQMNEPSSSISTKPGNPKSKENYKELSRALGVSTKALQQERRRLIQQVENDIIAHASVGSMEPENGEIAQACGISDPKASNYLLMRPVNIDEPSTSYTNFPDFTKIDMFGDITELERALGIPRQVLIEQKQRLIQEEKDAEMARMLNVAEEIIETRDCELARRLQNLEVRRFQKSQERRKNHHKSPNADPVLMDTYCQPRDVVKAKYNADEDNESQYMEVFASNTSLPPYVNQNLPALTTDQYQSPPEIPDFANRSRLPDSLISDSDPNSIDNLGPADDTNSLPKRKKSKNKKNKADKEKKNSICSLQ